MRTARHPRMPSRHLVSIAAAVVGTVALIALPSLAELLLSTLLCVNLAMLVGWTFVQRPASRKERLSRLDPPTVPDVADAPTTATADVADVMDEADAVDAADTGSGAGEAICRDGRYFLSVHVPTCSEPPAIVADTLAALARQRLDGCGEFEVVVIDNNTVDPRLWRPIESLCTRLGPRFRFCHRSGVRGAKAGALDIARRLADARTTHVVIVDADYRVEPDFLARAASALARHGCDYVQFPQAYRDGSSAVALVDELTDYFERQAPFAERRSAMLLTGTLSVVAIAALDAVGGWRARSVTEDAELGLRLQRAGFVGRFIDARPGRGLLPPNGEELIGQRHRWIVGNVHALLHALRDGTLVGGARRRAQIAQLTAWCSFVTLPAAVLPVLVLHAALHDRGLGDYQPSLALASVTVLWQAVASFRFLFRSCPGRAPHRCLAAWAVRWSLSLSSAHATLSALALRPIPFRRTGRDARADRRLRPRRLLECGLFLLAMSMAVHEGELLATLALALLALVAPLGMMLDRSLRRGGAARPFPSPPRTSLP